MNIQSAFASPVYYQPPYVWIPKPRGVRGLGSAQSQQINAIVSTGASTTIGILAALSAIPGPGWVAGAIGGLIAVGSMIANMFQGCGASCIQSSNDANKFEPPLQQNLSTYLNAPVHTASMQAAALNNVDTLFAALRAACSDPSLGTAGQNCISERLNESSCHWKASPGGWSQDSSGVWSYKGYGASGSGNACWNWVIGYRDPIANDPTVVPDSAVSTPSTPVSTPASVTSSPTPSNPSGASPLVTGSAVAPSSPSLAPLFLVGGGIVLLLLLMGGD
jgi:hypothetical protein